MLKLEFTGNTADEVNEQAKDYVSKLKGTRGGKNTGEGDSTQAGQAPTPLQPPPGGPAGFSPGAGFAPQAGGATQMGGAFLAAGATGPAPEVLALIHRINTRLDGAVASGQPAEAARSWLASQCGPDTANFTLEQIKTTVLPRMSAPTLEQIAKLMAA